MLARYFLQLKVANDEVCPTTESNTLLCVTERPPRRQRTRRSRPRPRRRSDLATGATRRSFFTRTNTNTEQRNATRTRRRCFPHPLAGREGV